MAVDIMQSFDEIKLQVRSWADKPVENEIFYGILNNLRDRWLGLLSIPEFLQAGIFTIEEEVAFKGLDKEGKISAIEDGLLKQIGVITAEQKDLIRESVEIEDWIAYLEENNYLQTQSIMDDEYAQSGKVFVEEDWLS